MKIKFIFNDAHQLKLIPENGKEKQLLQLCFGERPEVTIIASPAKETDVVIIQAMPASKQPVIDTPLPLYKLNENIRNMQQELSDAARRNE